MQKELFELIKACFESEISNEFIAEDNAISVKLANGAKIKILF